MENPANNWASGDAIGSVTDGSSLPMADLLLRIATSFPRIEIDWKEGDRWAEARLAKATAFPGYPLMLLEAERNLLGHTAFVSIIDSLSPGFPTVRFYVTPDTRLIELLYDPPELKKQCRELAIKLAEKLGYELDADPG